MLTVVLPPDAPVRRNRLFKYGDVETIQRGKSKQVRLRPSEVEACRMGERPDDPSFVPPPLFSSKLFCSKCGKRKDRDAFGKDARCMTRGGRRCECHSCRAQILKETRLKQRQERKQRAALRE